MSTRRGWQATVGELEAVLRHLDVVQGADAQVRDGHLWIRHHPRQPWMATMRIPATLAARARRWVATYVAAAILTVFLLLIWFPVETQYNAVDFMLAYVCYARASDASSVYSGLIYYLTSIKVINGPKKAA
jgi:hypothetical protein